MNEEALPWSTHSHTATPNALILYPLRDSTSVGTKQGELGMVNCIPEHVICIYKVIQSGKEKKKGFGEAIDTENWILHVFYWFRVSERKIEELGWNATLAEQIRDLS